jgi:hypothetical protein
LNIYTENFEDASIPKEIKFNEYKKFIIIETNDIHYLRNKIKIFVRKHKTLGEIKASKVDPKKNLLKITGKTDFNIFNKFIKHLYDKTPHDKNFNIKAILYHKYKDKLSYYLFWDQCEMILKGKTNNNKKIFVKTKNEEYSKEIVYYNYMINYTKRFNFHKFQREIKTLQFEKFPI